jgi:hypothetical protein
LTWLDGTVPALEAFSPIFSANAWAIWLRPAFSTQTNRISPFKSIVHQSRRRVLLQTAGSSILKNALRPANSFMISPNVHLANL